MDLNPKNVTNTDLEVSKTNVPDIRLEHRCRVLVDELGMIQAIKYVRYSETYLGVPLTPEAVAARGMARHT